MPIINEQQPGVNIPDASTNGHAAAQPSTGSAAPLQFPRAVAGTSDADGDDPDASSESPEDGPDDDYPSLEERARRLGIFSHHTLGELNTKPKIAIIEGLFYERTVNMVAGNSGIGKTPALSGMGICVAAGVPWLGRATKQGRVLYYDTESQSGDFRALLERYSRHLGLPKVPADFFVYNPNWSTQSPDVWLEAVAKHVAELKPTLVFFDPLRGMWPEAESKNEFAADLIAKLRQIGSTHGTTFVILHHLRKAGKDKDANNKTADFSNPQAWLDAIAGAAALVNQTDTRIGIQRSEELGDDGLDLNGLIRGQGVMSPFTLERQYDSATGEAVGYGIRQGVEHLSVRAKQLYEALPDTFFWADLRKTAKICSEIGTDSGSTCSRLRDELKRAGLLRQEETSKGVRFTKIGQGRKAGTAEPKAA